MTVSAPGYYLFDDLISSGELIWIYNQLIETPLWTLSRTSKTPSMNLIPFMGFPGLQIKTKDVIHHDGLHGVFLGLLHRIREAAKSRHSLTLPAEVYRIHVGAKSSHSRTEFHADMDSTQFWTILGFLNPIWHGDDGGEFYLEDQKIEFKPGRFILFRSNIKHDGGYVTNETLSYWRIAVNMILGAESLLMDDVEKNA